MTRVIGLGFRETATPAAIAAALAEGMSDAGHADAVAVLADRAGHPGLAAVPLPVVAVERGRLAGVATPSCSPRIEAAFGCGSVAEALAMVASGGAVTLPRRVIEGVTVAVAGTVDRPGGRVVDWAEDWA